MNRRVAIGVVLLVVLVVVISAAAMVRAGDLVVVIHEPANTTYGQPDVRVNVTAAAYGAIDTVLAEVDGTYNVTLLRFLTTNYYYNYLELNNGQHVVRIYANDTLGQSDSSQVCYFTVDTPDVAVTVRGGNDVIYWRFYHLLSDTWTTWNFAVPGATSIGPGSTINDGILYISAIGIADSIWIGKIDIASDTFLGWTLLDGQSPSIPSLASSGDTVSLTVRGGNDVIYWRFLNTTTGVWTAWNYAVPGATNVGLGSTIADGTLFISAIGFADSIWVGKVDVATDAFLGWTMLDGQSPTLPSLASEGNVVALTVRGGNDVVYWRFYDIPSDTWTSWNYVEPGATGVGVGSTIESGKLYISAIGFADSIWIGKINVATNTFLGWTLIDGESPSTPSVSSYFND